MEREKCLTTLVEIARRQAQWRGSSPALVCDERVTTFAQLDRRSNQVANGLTALGVAPGDHVAYLGKNSDRYFEALFGAAKAGAIMTPINWRLANTEIEYVLGDSQARLLFVQAEFAERARAISARLDAVRTLIVVDGDGEIVFDAWRDSQPDDDRAGAVSPDQVAMQLYTSGTTGKPKGAMLTHENLLGLRRRDGEAPHGWNVWTPDEVGLLAMPTFHIGGSGFGIRTLYEGAKAVIVAEFDPNDVLDLIETYRISRMFMVPSAMQIVLRHPRTPQVDFSCLKFIQYGASPIPLDLLRECMEVFGCGFVQMYGMTETAGTIAALPPQDHVPEGSPRMRSAGTALPGVEMVILDENGSPAPAGQVGEIAVRSAANMAGYWNLPEATAETLSADGWLRTGDAGYLDEEGYVYIQDRIKDMIISGGENVYPAEVENAIFSHPDVADVGVIGVPSQKWGEEVKAIVVLHPGRAPDAGEIVTWARERIAAYKAPKSVEFVQVLPRNASGKILRRELREPYWAGRASKVS